LPSSKKYCFAATNESRVEASKLVVPIMPAVFAKYLRPNKPSSTKVAKGNNGIQAKYK
jgi:hypothetical protein